MQIDVKTALQLPSIDEGELYVGCYGTREGRLCHVILLPRDNDGASWKKQLEWAKSIGGDLPNRIEQAMLWANHRDQFKEEWYWSNETCHWDDASVWSQTFDYGSQDYERKSYDLRARAVRRVYTN